ncbi:unnamed protein product [Dibothriocephalus latus]|uniref:Uncharacterized protein n=1 Tax=Dibothriocephalus latus TaxID=60516 RepID=A0A3P7NAA4_DIBLA|nr:unnamed protein product [Dibothriocephalus latus]
MMPFVSQSAWIGLRMRGNASQGAGPTGVYEWVSSPNRTATHQPDVGFFNWAARRYLDVGGHPGAVQVGPSFLSRLILRILTIARE